MVQYREGSHSVQCDVASKMHWTTNNDMLSIADSLT